MGPSAAQRKFQSCQAFYDSLYLILSFRQRVHNYCWNLVHYIVWVSGMQNTCEATHFGHWVMLELLIPVVHDAALPSGV